MSFNVKGWRRFVSCPEQFTFWWIHPLFIIPQLAACSKDALSNCLIFWLWASTHDESQRPYITSLHQAPSSVRLSLRIVTHYKLHVVEIQHRPNLFSYFSLLFCMCIQTLILFHPFFLHFFFYAVLCPFHLLSNIVLLSLLFPIWKNMCVYIHASTHTHIMYAVMSYRICQIKKVFFCK